MKKQTKNLTVSKARPKKVKEEVSDLDRLKRGYKDSVDEAIKNLIASFQAIPVLTFEVHNIYFQIQMIQGWAHLFINSLTKKQPPDDASP